MIIKMAGVLRRSKRLMQIYSNTNTENPIESDVSETDTGSTTLSDSDTYSNTTDHETEYETETDSESEPENESKLSPIQSIMESISLPNDVKEMYQKRIEQLNEMGKSNNEYFKLKRWVEGFNDIPFDKFVDYPFDHMNHLEKCEFIGNVKSQLDKVVYGHESTKTELTSMMVKWMVNPDAKGTMIALQGNKGIGKTSLIKNGISHILKRPVHHISLGGMTDGSFLDGHEFTYEGSLWGRIVDILMKSKCMNPIIFFDELDKISEARGGREIIGKLIHLTDHSQNTDFHDRYFQGVPIDLSKAIFIFSFNDSSLVEPILLDRLKVIKMEPFKYNDKLTIAQDYLLPALLKENSFKPNQIKFTDDAMKQIVSKYGNEQGVRNIRKFLEEIVMKVNVLHFIPDKTIDIDTNADEIVITPMLINKLTHNVYSGNDYPVSMYT
jgi:ATP-dependent Lon protease